MGKLGVYKFTVLVVHHHFKVKLMCTPTGNALIPIRVAHASINQSFLFGKI